MRAFAFIGMLGIAAVAHAAPTAPTPSEELLYFHCTRAGGELRGSMTTQLLLWRAAMDPALSDDENLRLAAEHQLRYLWGTTRADPSWPPRAQVVLSAAAPTITIVNKVDQPYGRDLELDWRRTEARLAIEPGYIKRAVEHKRVKQTDPALAATVRIEFDLAMCGRAAPPPLMIKTPLPRDPWLMYWLVDIKHHRTLKWHDEIDTTNPCADNDFADLPAPYYYWYDWYAQRHGRDIKGRAFDCRRWLLPGRDYDYYDVTLTPRAAPTQSFADLRKNLLATAAVRPLRATLVMGVLEHDVTDLQLEFWRDTLGNSDDLAGRAKAARAAWDNHVPREFGTRNFLQALVDIAPLFEKTHHTTRVDADTGALVLELAATFKQSHVPLVITFVLTMTDVFGPKAPRHWRWLEAGLLNDDMVLYNGHSGIGENFRLAQIEKNLGHTHEAFTQAFAKSPLQLVAIISCYSYMYFGQDLLAAGRSRPSGGTFIFTGNAELKVDRGPVPLFELLDAILAPDNTDGKLERAKFLSDDELWIIKRVRGAGTR